MGLSYAQDYSCRDHFRKRALERFGVDDQHLKRWINQHLPSLSPYESDVLQPADTRTYVSSDGVIFVCNIKSREFITCFKAVNYQENSEEDEAYTDIHESNVSDFKKDLTHLLNRYRLKEAKELFENIEDDLDDFYYLSQAVKTGQLSERNFKRLEELLSKFHVIKAAMRIIENKRGDYHL